MILTASPTENLVLNLGCSCCTNLIMASTSLLLIGVGLSPAPTKPVTPSVVLTTNQESSSRIIFTKTYPGKTFSIALVFLPFLTFTVSRTGIVISKTRSSTPRLLILCSSADFTLPSYPVFT